MCKDRKKSKVKGVVGKDFFGRGNPVETRRQYLKILKMDCWHVWLVYYDALITFMFDTCQSHYRFIFLLVFLMQCFETCQQPLVYFHWCCRRVSTVVSATLIYFLFFSLFLELDLFIVNIYFFCLFCKDNYFSQSLAWLFDHHLTTIWPLFVFL